MRCGLLGQSLKHSFSKEIHAALGGGYSYDLFEIEPEHLPRFLKSADWDGLNVTIPYKQTVIPYCAALSERASRIGSVNTIIRRPDGSLYGDNTDAAGFFAMLKKSGIAVRERGKVLVLGSGGSSRTVCHVLRTLGACEVVVISRHGAHNYETLDRHTDAKVIVNTTPVGMYPHNDGCPIDLSLFPALEGVLDLIYNPARTRLLIDAAQRKVPCIGGLSMLVGQAAAAAEGFLGSAEGFAPDVLYTETFMRRKTENVILIGMPGSGKTTVGQLLAKRLDRPFVDTDHELEKSVGMKTSQLLQQAGEAEFRAQETKILEKWGKESGLVIATGGGVVTKEENYPHLHQNGFLLFLERALSDLDREDRPLSQGDLANMYAKRLPLYQRFADCAVLNNSTEATAAEKAWEAFRGMLNARL